jgi:hypothetical protein
LTRKTNAALLGAAVALTALSGYIVVLSPTLAFVFLCGVIGFMALGAPTTLWVVAALVSAVTFPGLVGLGTLPAVATFLSIPLSWGALAAALFRKRGESTIARSHVVWLVVMATCIFLAALVNDSGLLRPLLDLALLGQPFALVGALLVDPPDHRNRGLLIGVTAAVVAIQVPIAYAQAVRGGRGDAVQGTLYATGAGAHVLGGLAALGAIWLLSGSTKWPFLARAVCAAALAIIPFLSDAKQVIFALPIAVIVAGWRGGKMQFLLRVGVVGACAFVLASDPALNQRYAIRDIQEAKAGKAGKFETASFIWKDISKSPSTLVFGEGPAETVSRAAFMTTPAFQKARSPLRQLGLAPAETARVLESTAPGGSFDAPLSSMLGVLGDLGIAGAAAYAMLLATLFARLQRLNSPIAATARAGLVLFLVLGFVSDWWEEPAFTLILASLVGMAITTSSPRVVEQWESRDLRDEVAREFGRDTALRP